MLIDRKQLAWLIFTVIASLAAVATYVWEAQYRRPSGSSPVGLTLGIGALVLMLFLVGLALRRRVPHWRIGRAQTWLRGHLWMGVLVVLLVALHGSFKTGGPLTTWLWVLLAVVTLTGVLGLLLQQFIPSLLLHRVPGETVAQQLAAEIAALPTLAGQLVADHADSAPLQTFYAEYVKPYLAGGVVATDMDRAAVRDSLFQSLRTMTAPHVHQGVDGLRQLCDRRRQLQQQRFWMRLLTAWLIVHVPLSWLLLVLAIVHGALALRWGG